MKKKVVNGELHTIENEKRPRVIKKRNGKTEFKAKGHRRRTQVIAMTSSLAILSVGIFAVGSILGKAEPNVVDPGFVTVSYTVPLDGSTPNDHSALENIGYMNQRFREQESWYSEMHGSTVANTMGINVNQSVNTYKQYQNNTLIMADITTSSMVNKARQFCYQGNDVIWRMGAGSPSTWPTGKMGDDCYAQLAGMTWKSGEPYGHMSLDDFTEKNGLPGTGFCVYVINEQTLLNADEVVDNGDGTYSQTYYLNPEKDKAPCHYVNQMVFTGDLPSLPVFNYITVTYTFDSTWQILRSVIDEQYTANMGVSAVCTSAYQTDFEYNTEKVVSGAYEEYFHEYIKEPFIEPTEKVEINSLNCLTSAFSGVLSGPVNFDLALNVNGKPVTGNVYVDVGSLSLDTMDIRARIGSLDLWLSQGSAYIDYGGMKVSSSLSELITYIGSLTGGSGEGISLDLDSLLSSLANGEFTVGENSATLSSTLSLGIDIPVVFHFNIDENKNVTLGDVMANLTFENVNVSSVSLGDIKIGAVLGFGEQGLPALTQAEKAEFADLLPVVKNVVSVIQSDVLAVGLDYAGDGFAVSGNFDIEVRSLSALDIAMQGGVTVMVGAAEKTVLFAYADGTLYFDLDGIKVKAGVKEGVALLSQYFTFDTGDFQIALPDIGELFSAVLSEDFASLLTLEKNDDAVEIAVKGTQLLKIFGVDFALGDIKLSVSEGLVRASVFGADVSLARSENKIEPVDGQEYADVLAYVQPMIKLFTSEAITADLHYTLDGLQLNGEVTLNLKELVAYGSVTVEYGSISKDVQFIYEYNKEGGILCLGLDGLKVRTDVSALLGVVEELLGTQLKLPETTKIDVMSIVEKVLAFDFGKLLQVYENENGLNAVVYGTELLNAFGVEFELGNVELTASKEGVLTASVLGATVTLSQGDYQKPSTEAFIDISSIVASVPEIVKAQKIAFAGNVNLKADKTEIGLKIERGILSWASGIEVRVDASVEVAGMQIPFIVGVTKEEIAFVVDGIAARVRFDEFETITAAVSDLYKEVATVLNGLVVTGEEDGLLADDLEVLMQKLGVADMLAGMSKMFDLSMLNELAIGAPVSENALCTLTLGALKAELFGSVAENYFGVTLGYMQEGLSVSGGLSVLPASCGAQMPDVDYLGTTDFIELLDYVQAALNTVTAQNLTVSVQKGTVSTVENENGTEVVKNYDMSFALDYYAGGKYPFVIDKQEQTVRVNVDLYAHVSFAMLDKAKADEGIFLDLIVLDYNNNEELDFFVTLSLFAKESAKYQPLKLYATAGELMDVLSTACAMLGIDNDLLNNYLVSKWVDVQTAAQLRTLGASLLKSFGVQDIFSLLSGSATVQADEGYTRENFIKELTVSKSQFVFDNKLFRAELYKTTSTDENGVARSYLTGAGVLFGDTCVDVTLDALTSVNVPAVTLDDSYFALEGVARLLKVMTTSATHADPASQTGYRLNDHFYIDGEITLNMTVIGINIKDVVVKLALSVSVSEEGAVSANVHIEVPGVAVLSYVAINGDTATDITLENGMIYMKRVQYTYYDGSKEKNYPDPALSYRVMPLATFTGDILDQLAYALNFGSLIVDNIPSGDGSGDSAPSEKSDIGAMFRKYIVSCVYAENSDGTCDYTLTINGNSLLEGMLKNIVIRIGTEMTAGGEEVIADLGINTNLEVSVLKVDVAGALRFENPCGIKVPEVTLNVEQVVSSAMEKALKEAQESGWQGSVCPNGYIEGQTTTVSYVLAGKTVAEQSVIFNTETGECYANLTAPAAQEYELRGYDIVWDFSSVTGSDGKFYVGANQIVYGSYNPKIYRVTLVGNDGISLEFDYVYGTDLLESVNAKFATGNRSAISCSVSAEDIVNGEREVYVEWRDFDYIVTYYDGAGEVFLTQYYKENESLAYPASSPAKVGYLLDGWKNAEGVRVESGSAVAGDMALYPVWTVDLSADVTVRLYSDMSYSNDTAYDPEKDGYFTTVTFTEQTGYALPAVNAEGCQQMGWWYLDAETGCWSLVTSVAGMNGADVWAIWIKNIDVTVTNFAKKNSTYTIEGTVEGGTVYGKKSKEVYDAVGMTETTVGTYTIIRKNGQSRDDLKYGAQVAINYGENGIGTFSESGMTSFNALFWTVGYGGIKITKTFSYGNGLSVSTENASYVSLDTYTVRFVDENGNLIKEVGGVRLDCPHDNYDNNVYIDKLAAREGIAAPAKEGYTARWEHIAVTGNMTVSPHYE